MYMPYNSNPRLPHVRMEAVKLVRSGWSTRKVARHVGYSQSVIVKWCARAPEHRSSRIVPTKSSRPWHHPRELPSKLVRTIVEYKKRYRRGAEFLHFLLTRDGYAISLSSVKRTLKRQGLVYPSRWKKWHQYSPRPLPERPGILVEIDTIVDGPHTNRLYVYTLLDVCSRWAYAEPFVRITTHRSLSFVERARTVAPFSFSTLQSDHGAEFSKWFTKRIMERGLSHRHSRVRQPNDNAHLERFNRTIQDECLTRCPRTLRAYRKEIPEYLRWYNEQRPHMGLEMRTPLEVVKAIPSY